MLGIDTLAMEIDLKSDVDFRNKVFDSQGLEKENWARLIVSWDNILEDLDRGIHDL
jgi:hypothetical protein